MSIELLQNGNAGSADLFLFDNLPVGALIIAPDGRFLRLNRAFTELTGYNARDVPSLEQWFLKAYPEPEYRETVKALWKNDSVKNMVARDIKIFCKNRLWKHVEFHVSLLADGSCLLTVTDISKRRAEHEALLQSESTVRNRLERITRPDGELEDLSLADLVDREILQNILESFDSVTGMGGAVFDIAGNCLAACPDQDVCRKFHRVHPETLKNCIESDVYLSTGTEEGEVKVYRCKNMMWDVVTPIFVEGKQLGNIFIGQFFYEDEDPDYELFRAQARRYGFDEEEYLSALKKIPRWSTDSIEKAMSFYSQLASIISTLSLDSIKLSRAFAQQDAVMAELSESEARYRSLVENSNEAIYVYNFDADILDLNEQTCRIYGYSREELLGQNLSMLDTPENNSTITTKFEKVLQEGRGVVEGTHRRKDGSVFTFEASATVISREGKGIIQSFVRDISDRKAAEQKIQSLLEEKEIILREVHHRIKNNMSTIRSLLSLQAHSLKSSSAQSALKDAERRISSMMLLYEKLYRSESVQSVSLDDYLPHLVRDLVVMFPDSEHVSLSFQIEPIKLSARRLSSLGIIVNELVTNAMKHAFSGPGAIEVSASSSSGRILVSVSDNGRGFENNPGRDGFGLELVEILSSQLGGTLRRCNDRGSSFTVDFPA
jgi:PAS domain S-box-containing protein